MSSSVATQARQLLRAAGARVTAPRLQVLAAMLESGHEQRHAARALSHHDIAEKLQQQGQGEDELPDRVTVYRVLEWLVAQGLAHKMAGDDRVFRFSLNQGAAPAQQASHAHFQCLSCHRMFCLLDSALVQQALQAAVPRGFQAQEVSAAIKGLCAECGRKN